jgi:hypothetical protein
LDSTLKVLKGRALPLAVNPCINANGLLQEALTKHSIHFRSFNGNVNEYVLLYPPPARIVSVFSPQGLQRRLGKALFKNATSLECVQKSEAESKPFQVTPSLSYHFFVIQILQQIVHNQSLEHKEVRATCPMCYLDLPIHEIEAHTDVCAEQIDPVGTVNMELESEMPDNQDEIVSEKVATIGDGSGKLEKIRQWSPIYVSMSTWRISIGFLSGEDMHTKIILLQSHAKTREDDSTRTACLKSHLLVNQQLMMEDLRANFFSGVYI